MAGGWAKDGAEQEQIERTLDDAVELARSRLPRGKVVNIVKSVMG